VLTAMLTAMYATFHLICADLIVLPLSIMAYVDLRSMAARRGGIDGVYLAFFTWFIFTPCIALSRLICTIITATTRGSWNLWIDALIKQKVVCNLMLVVYMCSVYPMIFQFLSVYLKYATVIIVVIYIVEFAALAIWKIVTYEPEPKPAIDVGNLSIGDQCTAVVVQPT
jgi:hypothetical protein